MAAEGCHFVCICLYVAYISYVFQYISYISQILDLEAKIRKSVRLRVTNLFDQFSTSLFDWFSTIWVDFRPIFDENISFNRFAEKGVFFWKFWPAGGKPSTSWGKFGVCSDRHFVEIWHPRQMSGQMFELRLNFVAPLEFPLECPC